MKKTDFLRVTVYQHLPDTVDVSHELDLCAKELFPDIIGKSLLRSPVVPNAFSSEWWKDIGRLSKSATKIIGA
jgi:hypothetical protein